MKTVSATAAKAIILNRLEVYGPVFADQLVLVRKFAPANFPPSVFYENLAFSFRKGYVRSAYAVGIPALH